MFKFRCAAFLLVFVQVFNFYWFLFSVPMVLVQVCSVSFFSFHLLRFAVYLLVLFRCAVLLQDLVQVCSATIGSCLGVQRSYWFLLRCAAFYWFLFSVPIVPIKVCSVPIGSFLVCTVTTGSCSGVHCSYWFLFRCAAFPLGRWITRSRCARIPQI